MKLSVVIPCYRSEKTIAGIVDRVISAIQGERNTLFDAYEVVCINDCSPDNTIQVLKELSEDNKNVKVIDLTRNYGQHAALMAGFNVVTGDRILCLDDDGQNPPEDMFDLLDKLEEGYDLVSAKYISEHRPLIRTVGSKISMAMSTHLIGMPKGIELNSFCAFKRFIADEIVKYRNPYPFVHGLMLRVTRNIANVDMIRNDRESGVSGYTFHKLLSLWLNGFTAFSVTPLRAASACGVISALLGFVIMIVTIIRKIMNPEIMAGYSSLMAVLMLFFGLTMLFLGLIGEYIGRMYICINDAPQYSVRETINIQKKKN